MKRKLKRKYDLLEQSISEAYQQYRENEFVLTTNDFKKGRLKDSSFIRLKEECWYIPYSEKVVIKTPFKDVNSLKNDLDFFGLRAISKIKNDRFDVLIESIILVVVGTLILMGRIRFEYYLESYPFLSELITIIAWVFIWSAVSNWFVDHRDLKDKRYTILQLLSANILIEDKEKEGEN